MIHLTSLYIFWQLPVNLFQKNILCVCVFKKTLYVYNSICYNFDIANLLCQVSTFSPVCHVVAVSVLVILC